MTTLLLVSKKKKISKSTYFPWANFRPTLKILGSTLRITGLNGLHDFLARVMIKNVISVHL